MDREMKMTMIINKSRNMEKAKYLLNSSPLLKDLLFINRNRLNKMFYFI